MGNATSKAPLHWRVLALLARWHVQLVLTLSCAGVASWCAQFADPSVETRLDFQAQVTLLGFLASILALIASLMVGHVLSYLDSILTEKTDLYLRYRDTLVTFDNFLREQAELPELIHESQSVSWELKKLRLEDFPIMDWGARLKRLGKILDSSRSEEDGNLPLEVMAHLGYCEELVSAIGLACIKQIIVRVLLQPILKMFFLIIGIILMLIYYCFCFAAIPVPLRLGIPVFFAVATALLCYEVAWWFYRHITENTDLKTEEDRPTE